MADNEVHECLRVLQEKWERPVHKAVMYDRESGELSSQWAIKMYNLTQSGAMSQAGQGTLLITYCPICGEKLTLGDGE